MKKLTFNNGATLEVLDASTIFDIIAVFSSPEDMIKAWDLFTKENMSHGYLGVNEFADVVPLDLDAIKDDSGRIIARFESRYKTEVELIKEVMIPKIG